jgi:hypothetical protein
MRQDPRCPRGAGPGELQARLRGWPRDAGRRRRAEKIKELKDPIDLVFLDADKEGYLDCLFLLRWGLYRSQRSNTTALAGRTSQLHNRFDPMA